MIKLHFLLRRSFLSTKFTKVEYIKEGLISLTVFTVNFVVLELIKVAMDFERQNF
jgi:hypothetical protein